MKYRIDRLARSDAAPALLAGGAALALAAALFFEHALGYAPCELCHWQRAPYYAALGLFAPPALFGARAVVPTLALAALLFLGDAAIAGLHVGVEQGWWQGPAACSASVLPDDPAAALDRILGAAVVRCDEVAWSFLGLSMAGWNLLIALGLTAFAIRAIGLRRSERRA